MENVPICIACENGEHDTFFTELAHREQKCSCACNTHHPESKPAKEAK